MKSTTLSGRGVITFIRKRLPSKEQLKTFTLSDFLSCLFAGVLSQGTLFGLLKPFGLAFYAAYSGTVVAKSFIFIAIVLGNLLRGDLFSALKQTATLFLYEWLKKVIPNDDPEISLLKNSFIIAGASAITGVFVFLINGQVAESILIIIMEAVLVSVVTALFSLTLLGQQSFSEPYIEHKNMEYFGLLVMGGAFLLGSSGIGFQGLSFDRIMAGIGLLMLTRHFGPGFGACAGTIAGVALSAGHPDAFPALIGIYAVSGFIAGMLQKAKAASGISFFLIHCLFAFTTAGGSLNWPDFIIPVILFWIIPDLKVGNLITLRSFIDGETGEAKKMDRVRQTVSCRIDNMSRALYKLGYAVEKQIKNNQKENDGVCGSILEQLAQQVCSCCGKSSTCWETKLFFTYKAMGTLIDSLQKNPADSDIEPIQELNRFCVKSGLVTDTLVRIIEMKRLERFWQKAVLAAQCAVPEQIYILSEMMTKMSGEMLQVETYFDEEEKKIMVFLRKKGFPVEAVEVKRGNNDRFMTMVSFQCDKDDKDYPKEIVAAVSKVLGVGMQVEDSESNNSGNRECVLRLKEKESIGVITGVARMKKNRANVSGDSFTFLKTREGKYIVAISDGMGSGIEANRLSETAVGLLEQLLDCGLPIRLSLSLVNTMIGISSPEKYATMDISAIDLYTGETDFYKMGAMPSMVVNGRNLDFIQITNLPAGLHQENPISFEKRKINDGDFIIMMSDGVYDRLSCGNEKTLFEKVISVKNTLNPQELAEHLLNKACENNDSVSDDMTVLVAKLWRKAV